MILVAISIQFSFSVDFTQTIRTLLLRENISFLFMRPSCFLLSFSSCCTRCSSKEHFSFKTMFSFETSLSDCLKSRVAVLKSASRPFSSFVMFRCILSNAALKSGYLNLSHHCWTLVLLGYSLA